MTAVIFNQDTLCSIGIAHILNDLFNIKCTIYDNIYNDKDFENYNLVIISSDLLAIYSNKLSTIKHKLIITIKGHIEAPNSIENPNIICQYWNKDKIISSFSDIISKLNKDKNIHNELSKREIDVLKLIVKGYINKEIAETLNISFNTVLTHRKNITSKLGIKSISGLSVYAMMNGIIDN